MSSVSTLRKIGIITKVAARQAGRNRTLGALWRAGKLTAVSLGKVLHQLWLEVTGFVFLVIAGIGGFALVRELHRYQAGEAVLSRIVVAVVFTLSFTWFGVSSFWRVRRKNQRN